jgi:hypothetical protein
MTNNTATPATYDLELLNYKISLHTKIADAAREAFLRAPDAALDLLQLWRAHIAARNEALDQRAKLRA